MSHTYLPKNVDVTTKGQLVLCSTLPTGDTCGRVMVAMALIIQQDRKLAQGVLTADNLTADSCAADSSGDGQQLLAAVSCRAVPGEAVSGRAVPCPGGRAQQQQQGRRSADRECPD